MNSSPRTVEDLVQDSVWMGKIHTAVSRYQISEAVEDVVADVLCQMLGRKKHGKNYIERWEPSLGSYSNWIYTFVNNVARKKYNREHSNTGVALRFAATIVETPEEDKVGKGEIPESWLPVIRESASEFNVFAEQILKQLSKTSAYSWIVYTKTGYEIHNRNGETETRNLEKVDQELVGRRFNRDLKTTFELLVQGFDPKDIAVLFQTSTTFVYSLIRKLRNIDAMQEWYRMVKRGSLVPAQVAC